MIVIVVFQVLQCSSAPWMYCTLFESNMSRTVMIQYLTVVLAIITRLRITHVPAYQGLHNEFHLATTAHHYTQCTLHRLNYPVPGTEALQ